MVRVKQYLVIPVVTCIFRGFPEFFEELQKLQKCTTLKKE